MNQFCLQEGLVLFGGAHDEPEPFFTVDPLHTVDGSHASCFFFTPKNLCFVEFREYKWDRTGLHDAHMPVWGVVPLFENLLGE